MVSSQHVLTSWDVKTGKNVKWVAQLGSQSYGNPVVAGGQVYVGTNNELVRDPKEPGDRGRVDGVSRIGRPVSVAAGQRETRVRTRQRLAVSRGVFVASGRGRQALLRNQIAGEIMCLDTHGDGTHAKVNWKFDMMEEVGPSRIICPIRRRLLMVIYCS